ncbi:MAG: FAD binding domain-containing protein [Acidobacteriota bacterium]|nr:FAD binding domain-containing protein [Acidobacteriota bacterium]
MIKFILNHQTVETDLPPGVTVLDFVRYHRNLKGTKIGCREGDCGACTVLVGELNSDDGAAVEYRSMTSCLMPLANARGKHIVTVEGINKPDGELTGVQQALVDESGTQCGFCTVGFVMSLTGFCLDETAKTGEAAVSSIDGNICRCTGYKSIERAAQHLAEILNRKNGGEPETPESVAKNSAAENRLRFAISKNLVPEYFSGIKNRLEELRTEVSDFKSLMPGSESRIPQSAIRNPQFFIGGGTDLYVQRHDEMVGAAAENLFDAAALRGIRENGDFIEIGASATVTDLLASPVMQRLFPNLYKHLKLVSSTPIRNMATLAGNFVNASPIGDMTAWFLALDAGVVFNNDREMPLRELYLGYKTLAKTDDEFITKIRFRRGFSHFNFEKVSKRTFLDIASVNTAISLRAESSAAAAGGLAKIIEAHISAGGVAPIPLYLKKTSEFLRSKEINGETISAANEILQTEISPISDVRGSAEYKRLLLGQLFQAHFAELFPAFSR